MPIYTSQIKGLVAGISVKVNTAASENTGHWIKVARVSTQTDFDTSQSVFLFTFPGLDMYPDHRYRNEFILIARYTPSNSGTYIDADGTMLELSSINANEINGFDPSTDIALLYNNENGDGGAEIWIKIPDRRVNVMVTPLSSTVETGSGNDYSNLGFEIIDGATTTNNFQGALPAEHIRNAADNADVDYGTVNGSWTDKVVGSLTLSDNVIKASDGGTAITLDTSSNVILSAKLRVPQYIEHNGDTDTRINFSTANKMVLEAGGLDMISISESTQDAVIINDGGVDVDFRVEGSSDPNAFFVRGSDNNVGIGTNTPGSELEVYNAGVTEVRITGDNSGDTRLRIDNGSSNHYIFDDQSDSNNFKIEAASNKALCFSTNGANERMRISSGGFVGILTNNPTSALEVNGDVQIFQAANNSDPFLRIGTGTTETLEIKANIMAGSQEIYAVDFVTKTASTTADRGEFNFNVDETNIVTIRDAGIVMASGKILTGDVTGDVTGNADTATTAATATQVTTTANNTADESVYLTFVDGTTGAQGIETDFALNYNPSTNTLTTTNFAGSLAGTASTATTVTTTSTSTDAVHYLTFVDTGTSSASENIRFDTGLTYNPNSNFLAVSGDSSFAGRLHLGGAVDPGPINTLAISLSMGDADNGILLYRNDSTTGPGNVLGGIGFDSTDGNLPSNTWEASAAIIAYAAEYHSTGDKGGYLTFRTAPIDQDDDTSSIERLRIEEDGKVYVLGANAYSSDASGDGTLIVVQNADSVDDGLVIYNTALTRAFRFWVGADNESNIFAGSSGNQPINISARPLRVLNGTDVSATADSGFLVLGDISGNHMSIDENEIQVKKATNDPAGTRLYLQALGGDVMIQRPSTDPGTALHVINEDEEDSILPTCYIQSNASDGANDSVILGLNYATISSTAGDSGDVHIDFQVNETSQGQIYASGTTVVYSAFTGVHISGIDPSRKEEFMTKGLIVSSDGSKKLEHISEAVTGCKISSHAKDKAVYGVVSRTPFDPTISKWAGFVEGDLAIHVNSVGNGMIWVTDITGNIECGDFICSSDISGYGQLQDDDILRNYTVAKCTESVDWSQISETIDHDGQAFKKCLIACTYHCG